MRAVFCHDNVYRTDMSGQVRSEGQFGHEAWARYLEVFDELTVVGRHRPLDAGDDPLRFNISERKRVRFEFAPDLSGVMRLVTERSRAHRMLSRLFSDADAVIVRGAGEISFLAAEVAVSLGKPLAIEVVGCAWEAHWYYGNLKGRVYAPVNYLRARRMIRKAPFAIYVSEKFLPRRYPNHGVVAIASNVEIDEPDPGVLETRLQRIEAQSEPVILGLIGSLVHRHKGIHVALKAVAKARRRLPHLEFRVLGNGDPARWETLAQRLGIADITRFGGTLPSGEPIMHWLDNVDIYLQPSLTEGVPRAAIEAMSRGCPALGSFAGGIPELLNPAEMHPPGDHHLLAEQVVRAVNDRRWQAIAARRNFDVARDYSRSVLSARRTKFWRAFAEFAAVNLR
jgi:glycosyltransferase involved in cell wall biosynthesis